MTLHRAVGCDVNACLALYVAAPQLGPDAALYAAQRAGWEVHAGGLSTRCPSCARDGLPVLERGECPVCCGSTVDTPEGERCHHCGHVLPHPCDPGEELEVVAADADHGDQDDTHTLEGTR
ncbi:hypothetical protein [Streptomyces pseudogriseolus]|uniref:hypothetical protein n=1 Tax=Streptomyces pseudogriseolus TaxID=36817 RepID=UPI003FA2D9AF